MSKMKQRMAFVMSLAMAFTSVDTGLLVSAEDVTTVAEESTVEVQDVEEEAEEEDVEVADGDVEEEIVTDGEVAEQALGEEEAVVIEPQEVVEEGSAAIATYEGESRNKTWEVIETEEYESIKMGEKITLTPQIDNPDNVPLTYKWRIYDTEIQGAIGSSLEIDSTMIESYVEISCDISDETGATCTVEFDIDLYDTGEIHIYDDTRDSWEETNSRYAVAKPGTLFTMSVQATSTEITTPVWSYQWYKLNKKTSLYEKIENAKAAKYEKVTEQGDCGMYRCVIGDGSSYTWVDYEVVPDSGFSVKEDNGEVAVKQGADAVLVPSVTTKYGTLSYKWYKENQIIGTDATYTVTNVTEETVYSCYVTDGYDEYTFYYRVYPEQSSVVSAKSNLKVSAVEKVAANKGDKVTLSVDAIVDQAYQDANGYIGYDWAVGDNDELDAYDSTYSFTLDSDEIVICRCYVETEDAHKYVYILVGPQAKLDKVVTTATDFGSARTLSVYGPETVLSLKGENEKQYFKFVPDKDGVWEIGADESDLVLYNAAKEKMCSRYNYVVYRLKANETYYVEVTPRNYMTMTTVEADYLDYNTAHKWKEAVVTKAATCTTAGEKAKECVSCGMIYYETIPALGHTFNAFTVTKEASVLEEGSQYHTCSVCGTVETVAIPKLVSNVTLINSTLPLQVKQKASLSKNVKGLATGDKIVSCTLSAKDKKIVSVDKKGTVKGKKAGTATITMKFLSGATAKVKVKVQKKKVATSKITNVTKNITLKVKKSTKLAPFVTPVTSKNKVTYKTSNKKIATVSSKGVIKAKKAGTATITVKSGSKTVKVKVKVTK